MKTTKVCLRKCAYPFTTIIQKFHFSSKNGILKIKFDNYQVYIKNQANEGQRIYVKIMFRLNEKCSEMHIIIARPYKIVSNS